MEISIEKPRRQALFFCDWGSHRRVAGRSNKAELLTLNCAKLHTRKMLREWCPAMYPVDLTELAAMA
jgi:hypothetical protein